MPIIVSDESLWVMFARLREYDGRRCLWRAPVAAIAFLLPSFIFVGATVLAAFIAGSDFNLRTAILAAIIGAGATAMLAPRLARRRLYRKVIADRLWTFEALNPRTEVHVLMRAADLDRARTALRRANFNPQVFALRLGAPPLDASDLDYRIAVHEPAAWPQSASDEDRTRRIVGVLKRAGVRACVAGIDTQPGDGTAQPLYQRVSTR